MVQEQSLVTDTLEFVVKDSNGNIKESRFIINRDGLILEFIGNERYNSLLNEGKQPLKIPFINGKWNIRRQ